MRAHVGDLVHTHGASSSEGQRTGEIVEVRGAHDGPPYLVRFPDGKEMVLYPGPETEVESRSSAE